MDAQLVRGLLEFLQQVPDPRGRQGQRHSFVAMLATVICATLSGCGGFRATMQWLDAQGLEFWHVLGGTRRPPVRSTFQDLLAELDPDVLFGVLAEFIGQFDVELPEENVEIWDGKVLRGTRKRHAETEKLLVRFDLALGRAISSFKLAAGTNEITAAQTVLKGLLIEGKIVVGDAIYCQREICEKIVSQTGHYVFTVKDNQPQLHRDVKQAFVIPEGFSPLRSEARAVATANLQHN